MTSRVTRRVVPDGEFLAVFDIAQRYNVSSRTVYGWVKRNEVKFRKEGKLILVDVASVAARIHQRNQEHSLSPAIGKATKPTESEFDPNGLHITTEAREAVKGVLLPDMEQRVDEIVTKKRVSHQEREEQVVKSLEKHTAPEAEAKPLSPSAQITLAGEKLARQRTEIEKAIFDHRVAIKDHEESIAAYEARLAEIETKEVILLEVDDNLKKLAALLSE